VFIREEVIFLAQYAVVGLKRYCVEISSEDFDLLRTARTHLFEALSIEEKLNLVLENYAEFEQELLNFSVNSMLFQDDDWSSGINEIHLANRRIINLLTTGRLCIDQVSHNIRSIYGADSEQEKAVKEKISQRMSEKSGQKAPKAIHCL
jgi:hypothetical protein